MADSTEGANGVTQDTRASRDAADRAAFLRGEDADDADEKPATERESEDEVERDQSDADDDIDLDDEVDVDDDEEADDAEDEKSDGEKPDADTSKRMDAIRRREQRSREQLATERKTFESERESFVKEWKPRIEAAEKFEAMKARGVNAYNALDVLRELGMPDSDILDASRAFYAASEDGKKDPKNAEAMARSKRERERDERLARLEREREDEKKAAEKQRAEEANVRAANAYLDSVAKAAPDGTLAKHYLKESPEKTRRQLGAVAFKLFEKNGEQPTPKQVIAAYEKSRAKQLKGLGVDPTTITKKAATGKPDEAKKPADKTNGKSKQSEEKPFTREDFINARDYD